MLVGRKVRCFGKKIRKAVRVLSEALSGKENIAPYCQGCDF